MAETIPLDPRRTPARPDLAAAHLRGRVQAAHFVEGSAHDVIDAHAPLRRAPSPDAPLDTEALMGERVHVYEANEEGWSWVQLARDGYVGWMSSNSLSSALAQPTHKVRALRTLVFPGPDIKLPPVGMLPLGAQFAVTRMDERFAVTGTGFIPARHVAPLAEMETDAVAVAERFFGTPYLWGGKTGDGIDCSGLVQVSLTACGLACPRDSYMQEDEAGEAVALSTLRRGDLIFWKGHVAIARDAETIIHANAFHMAVAIEPLAQAVERIEKTGSLITSVRRPPYA